MNCIDCKHHEVINDKDPDDWFCDDDVAVVCKLSPCTPDTKSRYRSDHSSFRRVASACRPYRLRAESETPKWCPL